MAQQPPRRPAWIILAAHRNVTNILPVIDAKEPVNERGNLTIVHHEESDDEEADNLVGEESDVGQSASYWIGVGWSSEPPPAVNLPQLPLWAGSKEPGDADPTVEAFAPTLWLLRYPPLVGRVPPVPSPHRYLVANLGPLDHGKEDVIEIKSFPDRFFNDLNKAGIVAHPTMPGNFCVADLRAYAFGTSATREIHYLVHDSTLRRAAEWQVEQFPGSLDDLDWNLEDVVSHEGKISWIDHRQGIYTWNVFGDKQLRHSPLPPVGHGGVDYHGNHWEHRRFVQFSLGRFRCIDICAIANLSTTVTVRTLRETGAWSDEDYTFSFRDIWLTDAFRTSMLPFRHSWQVPRFQRIKEEGDPANCMIPTQGVPVFAFMDPTDPEVLYFFTKLGVVGGRFSLHLYAVDGRTRTYVHQNGGNIDYLGSDANHNSVRAWVEPPPHQA